MAARQNRVIALETRRAVLTTALWTGLDVTTRTVSSRVSCDRDGKHTKAISGRSWESSLPWQRERRGCRCSRHDLVGVGGWASSGDRAVQSMCVESKYVPTTDDAILVSFRGGASARPPTPTTSLKAHLKTNGFIASYKYSFCIKLHLIHSSVNQQTSPSAACCHMYKIPFVSRHLAYIPSQSKYVVRNHRLYNQHA